MQNLLKMKLSSSAGPPHGLQKGSDPLRQTALYPSRIILSAENCHRATADWQCAVGTIVPKQSGKTIRRITVYCAFDHNSGTARFDNLSLRQEPVQTYSYNADGNVTAATQTGTGTEKAGYTGAWQRYTSPVQSNVTVSATYTKITTYYTVTFVADGFTVKTMQVYSGYVLKDSDYPSVPEKVGYTGHWNKITAPITKNTFVYAVYYSTDPTHIVTFYFAGEDYGTLTVDDGYILQDCDYPELPTRDGYTAYWDTYTQPIRKDITVTGNWEENAIIPPQPTDPPEIMSGDASEPVEAGAEAYASGALVSTETVTHEYLTQSGKIVREVIMAPMETTTLDFFYDESGRPFAFNYTPEGSTPNTYYYILNLQGDVVQIIDEGGVLQAEYIYSPWGEIISAEGDLAEVNPLRYRGYYYDSETGFYYLQSRYYDPENHRFINADCYASTGQGFIGTNAFSYCGNAPSSRTDGYGFAWTDLLEFVDTAIQEVGNALNSAAYDFQRCAEIAQSDGPLPILDIAAAVAALAIAGAAVIDGVSQALEITTQKKKAKDIPLDRAAVSAFDDNNYSYWAAEIHNNVVIATIPLTYSEAQMWVSEGRNLLCRDRSAAIAIVKFWPSSFWDGRHGCATSGYLNHYHLSTAHGNHVWYIGE